MQHLPVAVLIWIVPAVLLGILAAMTNMRYLRSYQSQYSGTAESPPTIYQRQRDARLERQRRWMYCLWLVQAIWLFAGVMVVVKFFLMP